jgi:hypothetical protein
MYQEDHASALTRQIFTEDECIAYVRDNAIEIIDGYPVSPENERVSLDALLQSFDAPLFSKLEAPATASAPLLRARRAASMKASQRTTLQIAGESLIDDEALESSREGSEEPTTTIDAFQPRAASDDESENSQADEEDEAPADA